MKMSASEESICSLFRKTGSITILVRPRAAKNEIIGWDDARQAMRVNIAAPPENNRANMEVIKFFSKLVGKRVAIVRGMTGREKVLRVVEGEKKEMNGEGHKNIYKYGHH